MHWLLYFVLAFLASWFVTWLIVKTGRMYLSIVWRRLGGIGILTAFLSALLFCSEIVITWPITGIIAGCLGILMFGFWDDLYDISWKKQLLFQVLLGILLIAVGYRIDYISSPFGGVVRFDAWQVDWGNGTIPIIGSLFILFWIIGIMNAINWADGIDGLSGGIGILSSLAIFLVSLRPEVNQPAVAILSIILVGAILGFWWFNFPKALIEAGTSGSYGIGFIIAALAIMAGTKIATAMIVLSLPLIDAIWVVWERKRNGQSVFRKDVQQRHLHYRLRNLGWNDRTILLAYLGFLSVMLGISLLFDNRWHKFLLLACETGLAVYIVSFLQRKERLIMNNTTVNETQTKR